MSAVVIVLACVAGMALCMLVMSAMMRWRRRADRAPDSADVRHGENDEQ